jgi:hypothetical protein
MTMDAAKILELQEWLIASALGRYALRGVRQAQELFTLDEYAPL